MVTLPGSEGETGIYPNHVPLMTKVQAGELVVKRSGTEEILAVGEGFAEITGDHVAILTDNAIDSADIDEAAAEEAKDKAEQRLAEGGDMTEEEAKALNQAILYSAAQLRAKRFRR
jgi:F-type H+-transporting ATPase subunit epsilon